MILTTTCPSAKEIQDWKDGKMTQESLTSPVAVGSSYAPAGFLSGHTREGLKTSH